MRLCEFLSEVLEVNRIRTNHLFSIRPLLSQDLKIRKISGRHQISADGKHLVDGLAFGRPLLRQPADRPSINIPPRKRRRITCNEDEEDDEGFKALMDKEADDFEDENVKQLVLHADFDDDDEEDDEDFAPGEDEDIEEEDESEEVDDDEKSSNGDGQEEREAHISGPQNEVVEGADDELALADVSDLSTRAKIRKLHSAFPKSPLAVCKYILSGTRGDVGEAYDALARGFPPVKPKSAVTEISQEHDDLSISNSQQSNPSSGEESKDEDSMEVDADDSQDRLLEYYDQNGLPPDSITTGKALSFMAEVAKSSPNRRRQDSRRTESVASKKSIKFTADEDLSKGLTSTPFIDLESPEEDDSEEESEDSSDEDDATSSIDSSEEEADNIEASETSSSSSDGDSSSDSSSENESPEETSSKPSSAVAAQYNSIQSPSPKHVDKKSKLQVARVPPGQGSKRTRKRNERRKNHAVLARFKEKGILPAGTTISEFSQLHGVDSNTSPEDALAALEAVRAAKASEDLNDFERRRQGLLKSLASGGIELGPESSNKERGSAGDVTEEPVVEEPSPEAASSQDVNTQRAVNTFSTAPETRHSTSLSVLKQTDSNVETEDVRLSIAPDASTLDTTSASPQPTTSSADSSQARPSRRSKLDLGAGRRLLFGALGIKNPKTKHDEEKVRRDLMKDIKPVMLIKSVEESIASVNEEIADEDPDAWRDKIIYRAVECVHEGVELSEPPFPFVQRWDPQQQGSWSHKGNRGGKRKKDQRGHSQYYNEDPRASKKQKRRKGKHSYAEEQEYLDASYEPSYQEDTIVTDYDETTQVTNPHSDDADGEINQQLMNDIQVPSASVSQDPDDLAPLPEDPSSLPDLEHGKAEVGMTIAFKQLEMSAATQWQPQISPYRTAIVIALPESGELHLTLAMRDRKQSSKLYDEDTGERVYHRFDMPGSDDEMDEEDDGMLNVSFGALMEPKILQNAPANLDKDTTMNQATQAEESIQVSLRASNRKEAAEVQFSHVTETPLHADAPDSNPPEESTQTIQKVSKRGIIEESVLSIHSPVKDVDANPLEESTETIQKNSGDAMVEEAVSDPSYHSPAKELDSNPATSSLRGEDVLQEDPVTLTEQVSDENRKKILHMMKEAGFRSSVPSSIVKDIRPSGMESPGDAAVFEKLMRDMTEIDRSVYSPKFNGFGSRSPAKIRETSQTPLEKQRERSSSPVEPQSSWVTVGEKYVPSSSPRHEEPTVSDQDHNSSWETDSEDQPSSPPVPKNNSSKKTSSKKIPVGRAQAMWEALQPKSRKATSSPAAKGAKTSPDPALGLDGVGGKDSTSTVQYPKLSVGSLFTSQTTDHGRQPDFNFEEIAATNADTPKVPEFDVRTSQNGAAKADSPPELPSRKSPDESDNLDHRDDHMSDEEPQLPRRKSSNKSIKPSVEDLRNKYDVLDDALSSDSPFPTLEEVLSQRTTIKIEKAISVPPKGPTKADREYKKAMAELSEDSDQSTPKASQKQKRLSRSRSTTNRGSESRSSKPRASQSFASQPGASQPSASQSQCIDLTLSSDVEPEPEVELADDNERPAFKTYNFGGADDDDDDDDDEDFVGWGPKKASTLQGVETRNKTSPGLRDSSQASLNSRSKKAPRF